jgi:hypothetical protein
MRQLSHTLLTLMSAPAAGLGVGWLVLTDAGPTAVTDRYRCEPVVRSIAANNGNCCLSRRAGRDGAFLACVRWRVEPGKGAKRCLTSPAVVAGNGQLSMSSAEASG